MARQTTATSRGSAWRDIALAGGIAAAAIVLLAIGVMAVWILGRSPSTVPAIGAGAPPTPTPRAISLARSTAVPETRATDVPETAVAVTEPAPAEVAPAATVAPLILASASTAVPPVDEPLFAAPDDTAFSTLATRAWTATADTLANDGSIAVAEPWLTLATVPDTTFAVEAEIRVIDLLDSVCDQSFGLAAGAPAAGQAFGGGVFFPCAEGPNRARLTDVAIWEDGYNGDAVFAEEEFEPGDDWRVYRFELRGEELQLTVDGIGLVSASPPAPLDPAVTEAEAGIWTQGVGIEVRRVTIYPLPA